MKRLLAVIVLAFAVTGCASSYPLGAFYTELKLPVQGVTTDDISYSKVGVAQSFSYFSLVATGDSSIRTAAENGGIKKIKYIDWDVRNILGIYGQYKTTVYGD